MNYYICNYADYSNLPSKLFCEHSANGLERNSLDGLKFIARCKDHTVGEGCLFWMNGGEQARTNNEILIDINSADWSALEE